MVFDFSKYNDSDKVTRTFTVRVLIVLLCVALLSFAVLNPAGPQLLAVLVPLLLLLTTLSVLRTERPPHLGVPCQPVSFLSLDSPRAPPQA